MSERLAAAAEKMGVPAPLVERAARAWAAASGQSYDDVLAAWAGGAAVAAAPPPEPEPTEETAPEPSPEPAAAPAPPPAAEAPRPAATVAAPQQPPVLDAPPDRPLITVAGGLGVVLLVVLLAFVFPALPTAGNEVRTSAIDYSPTAELGQRVYRQAGCASCHTQVVRPVVADIGLGPVSLPDSNQVIGARRLGPDLADVGNRLDPADIAAALTGGHHPPLALSEDDFNALIAYLAESAHRPAPVPGGEQP